MFLPQAVGTEVNKNGLFACGKQLYNLITVMPPPSCTHTCARPLPIKVMLGHFTGGRDGEDVDECFMGKSSECWHFTK